ncbi:hypothetical protein [Paenarthrobacter sp. PH39-S1]|uniref:hypothetical protein n=1 Tax=Paenarthrobacter sp. PH39-S1 TaxID=3046204 RepID=UPI0024BB8151|nr:hypothetical protein [Paenarthrobacter sp. PH39-S1]MDJ0356604.1 hypothetical protein [Paenarthrobacter sp. PH39-S1]
MLDVNILVVAHAQPLPAVGCPQVMDYLVDRFEFNAVCPGKQRCRAHLLYKSATDLTATQ